MSVLCLGETLVDFFCERPVRGFGEAAARATEGWGAIDALPDAILVACTAKRPSRARIRAVRDRLRGYYGRPRNEPHHAPLDELVLTVLSQNTNDRNRDVAYVRLRARFPDWEAVAAAPWRRSRRRSGPAASRKVKSLRIKSMLEVIQAETGGLDLGFLATAPREEAFEFLERLPGVGRKTAACVLMFAYDRPEIPVDTHVYRVCTRLALLRPKAPFERGARRTARGDRSRRRVRAARQFDPPRAPALQRPQPRLPALPAARRLPVRQGRDRPLAVSEGARLRVRVQPRAAANEIVGERGGVLIVRVTAAPAGGAANTAVRKLIARRLRVGITRVELVRGATAREKDLLIREVSDADLRAALGL